MMESLIERQNQIVSDFKGYTNWEDRYKHIIKLGKDLPELEPSLKVEEAKVKGCQSQVWLHGNLSDDGKIIFKGDSDALIVRGLVAILIRVYSLSTPQEIIESSPQFIKDLGFDTNLSPSRTNGLFSMIKQIHHFATAFSFLLQTKK